MEPKAKQRILDEVKQTFGSIPAWLQQIPDVALTGFWSLFRDVELAETVIPNKYKELIGLAVSGATRCRYCALFHTEAAKLFGASDAEIAEASFMGGFTMLASTFLNAEQTDYERFRSDTLAAIDYARHQTPATKVPVTTGAHA